VSALTPLLFSAAGPVATSPAALQAALIALVQTMAPGYTAALPGSLIEDISSTDVGALATIDQARVDAVNNVSPYAANAYVLSQLGAMFGVPQGAAANGNAFVVFSGSPGYVIPANFTVGDGTNQYAVQDGGIIGGGGNSPPLFVLATNSGTFAIPANSITAVITSVPLGYTITCTNPSAGVPATSAQTIEAYRAQVIQAFQVSISGTPTYLKTLLELVPGVSPRLVSVIQSGFFWKVICGGGDPYLTAGAIYQGVSQIGLLTGSSTSVRNISVSIYDAPNTYNLIYVNPPQQLVTVAVTWNTTLINFTAGSAVNQYIIAATQAYINSIIVGQPINLLVLTEQIQAAIASVLAPINLTRLVFAVNINGTPTSPNLGTEIIPSDPESYFYCNATGATAAQG
jgi:hypothetical protein